MKQLKKQVLQRLFDFLLNLHRSQLQFSCTTSTVVFSLPEYQFAAFLDTRQQ